ncbi:beta-mannosidase [Saccharicrinis fermentans]|uniref:Beta-mannosidase B n=1 Tax=Saccharicrinis fermentans DSM 9555 = JCM 21142 TaxID=869213 RepID=W7YNZ0_9BACT|nr:glycoside hydrolase family 2 protein [Saccharicrinis fermentans]GAF04114.1 exo-beta-D-glucosaminidase precursor [Saccharicrinis fermentans DSM 9555 = JCM 21142]
MKNYLYYLTTWIAATIVLSSCQPTDTENMKVREINSNWKYAQVNGDLSGEATVPGVIHTDLLNNKQIEDPFYRTNEKDQQWIDKEDWEYSTNFVLSAQDLKYDNMVLNFEGLDTYADVYLNGEKILEADNMFRRWEVDIKTLAKEGENELKIYFHSPIKKGLELLETADYAYPAINDQSENGGLGDKKVSIFTRKAGYHYGWDWGPRFVTSGIWKPVMLKFWNELRINNVFIKQPSVTKKLAKLEAVIELQLNEDTEVSVIVINKENNHILAEQKNVVSKDDNSISIPFEIQNPKLWWSNGLGDAHMYAFEVKVMKGNKELASSTVNSGLRSLKLIREKDEVGESFVFELNGVRVFAKGANYIPNDNFVTRVTKADYEKIIADAVNANMNMLRVWGGGIYENDYFYDLCDQNGIMVWQDFMFACSMYPGNDRMLASIKEEAKDNVIRLRNHPSIAVWCGNNEINAAWSYYSDGGWGWKETYTAEQREEIQKAYLDIFHDVLPEVVSNYTDGDDYWPSSPQAGFEPDKHAGYENTAGDMHYWGVWHGKHPFEDFDKYKARFMSEYGFQSFPDFETVKKYAIPEDFDIESEVMATHQRSGIGNLRIKEYMSWDYKVPEDFEHFLYMSQVLQARGVKMAIEAHRRAMPYCMGTLYWQINDCWPVASWSSTDYYHKWKALHYAAKRAYEPLMISSFLKNKELDLYVVSDLLEGFEGQLQIAVLDFEGKVVNEKSLDIIVGANTSTFVQSLDIKTLVGKASKSDVLVNVKLVKGQEALTTNNFYLVKPKEQTLPEVHLSTSLVEEDGKQILEISTDKLARDIYLNIPDQEVFFSDNYFDLLPGEKHQLAISGSGEFSLDKLQITHLQEVQR